jgi:hypothetical protein
MQSKQISLNFHYAKATCLDWLWMTNAHCFCIHTIVWQSTVQFMNGIVPSRLTLLKLLDTWHNLFCHHRHYWQNGPFWAIALLRGFCQICLLN